MIGETRTLVILVVVVCAFLGAIGQVFFKMGADLISADITSWLPKILVGFGLYGLSSILFILALRHGNLTLLYPIIATSYIWTMVSERIERCEHIYEMTDNTRAKEFWKNTMFSTSTSGCLSAKDTEKMDWANLQSIQNPMN